MLNSEPIDALEQQLERWAAILSSCAPADRMAAESGIRLAYRAAGLAPPQQIVWCGGPVEIAKRLAAATADDRIGANVKAQLFDAPRNRVGAFAEIFWKEIFVAASELGLRRPISAASSSLERAKLVGRAIHHAVCAASDDTLFKVSVRARHAVQRWRGGPRLLPKGSFSDFAVDPDELASLCLYEFLGDVMGWTEQTDPLQGLWAIAKNAGWIMPYEHVCWISERPDTLMSDTRGRLHCVDGPALRYRDGWSVFAWKGVEVPAWVIEHPERITPSRIADAFDPILRNTMIDIMTPERFIASGAPSCVSKDETGLLWRQSWTHRNVTIGSWCAVQVVNGTPEADGTLKHYVLRVPPHVRTAREAVAWTYGISSRKYAELELRT